MDLECPYCEAELEICHDDGFGYEENIKHHIECDNCGKWFVFETTIVFYYSPEKADCLNDNKHIWKPTTTFPKEYMQMECVSCGEKRKLTNEEQNIFLNN